MDNPQLILTPTDFVAVTNQILEQAYGFVYIQGELANFRISKNRWVYFDIKDEFAKVSCFGTVYALPGPLEEGMLIKVAGQPRLHPQFGFSVNVRSIQPAGEGAIKKAFELLKVALSAEGLFDENRKRILPYPPQKIALITSIESAAYADFIKILNSRWPFIRLEVYDTQVQGEAAPAQITAALTLANSGADLADVLVITRGGGSADDLSAFNDERVVRVIASSRIPTLVAIGHEIDESLSELVADKRASTPSNAAELLVPDKKSELANVSQFKKRLHQHLQNALNSEKHMIANLRQAYIGQVNALYNLSKNEILSIRQLITAYNPEFVLKRGYTLVRTPRGILKSVKQLKVKDQVLVEMYDGEFDASVRAVHAKL